MVATSQNWAAWLERLYDLRRDKRGTHERPHKPVLLLTILDLLDRGALTANQVVLSEDLIATFKRYFAVVRKEDDQPTIQNPFFHLCGDGFWRLVPLPGQPPIYREGATSGGPRVAELRRRVAYGRFDEGLWDLLKSAMSRYQLREALIAPYFPEDRDKLEAVTATSEKASRVPSALREEMPPGRDVAFRHTILEVYDFRCAACGLRVLVDQQESLVEAAHLIPFGLSRNDRPTNGMAL